MMSRETALDFNDNTDENNDNGNSSDDDIDISLYIDIFELICVYCSIPWFVLRYCTVRVPARPVPARPARPVRG